MRVAIYLALVVLAACASAITGPSIHLVRGDDGRVRFVLRGVERVERPRDEWQRAFAIYVAEAAAAQPMFGRYELTSNAVMFEPRFPLTPGVEYRAVYDGVERRFTIPGAVTAPTARVADVYPSSDVVPENLLKFYLHFNEPMAQGASYEHVRLIDETRGREVELPFLEIGQEFWDRSGTRLTLLIDPGRIKRGLLPREQEGPVLVAGRRYTLAIDDRWESALGLPMLAGYRKSFTVAPPDEAQPDPSAWQLRTPSGGTRDPLVVTFPEPLDHALLMHMLDVRRGAAAIAGEVDVSAGETRWTFTPLVAWQGGAHTLVVDTDLEDRAGNNIRAAFDVDTFGTGAYRLETATAQVSFVVR